MTNMESLRPVRARKQRIPKACGACRRAKAKCDGKRPCTRCRGLNKACAFTDRPKEAHELKIEALEKEIESLKARLEQRETSSDVVISPKLDGDAPRGSPIAALTTRNPQADPIQGALNPSIDQNNVQNHPSILPSLSLSPCPTIPSARQKKSSFDSRSGPLTDCIDASLVTPDQAESYFAVFFQGCHRSVPIFDPSYDSLASIRERSSLLLTAICTVGCRIATGAESHQWRLLDFHLKRMLNCVLATPYLACLETVQAFLVRSCYAPERSLLVAAATRMATDLGFPDAYDQLISLSITCKEKSSTVANNSAGSGTSAALMRRTRTWLHLLVLGHIYHVDAADLMTFRFAGDVRRCRIVLKSPFAKELDLFLVSQVELNVIRARIYDSLSTGHVGSDDDSQTIAELVREARIDMDIWFDDWAQIFEKHGAQSPWLMPSLRVQKCWADNMVMCRAVRASGVEDVDFMSSTQREFLSIARDALEEHLNIMIEEPRIYVRNLRFAMDFVWAKCTFCYLLLIKLSLLLPGGDGGQGRTSQELIDHGNILLAELQQAGGESSFGYQSNTSKLYIQLLKVGIDRYSNTLTSKDGANSTSALPRVTTPPSCLASAADDETQGAGQAGGLESFVPEQFVFEWDFPGLTLFSSGIGMAWLDDILLDTLNGKDDLFGWDPVQSWTV